MKHSYYYQKLKHDLQVVQLHGKNQWTFVKNCEPIAKRYWNYKVFSIQDEFDFSALKPFEEFCDYFLFDTKITWKRNNFRLDSIKKISFDKAVFLSGGIGLEELKAVQEITKQIYLFTL
jgi:phosphoribosylanthranilate isomerase